MAISKSVLGMNARNFLYIRPFNKPSAKRIADDKLETKKILIENDIPTPSLLAIFYTRKNVRDFDWDLPENGFAIKPARGYGGSGIIAFKSWRHGVGTTVSGEEYTIKQLESHIFNILDGAFSLQFLPDKAFIEERVIQSPFFKNITPVGLADIRIIVFRHVPVMAMLRIPTLQSFGKANLHLGALAVGIDLATGITTSATSKSRLIYFIPQSKKKTAGIKLPNWDDMLLLASRTQNAVGLGFAGVDLVIDAKKGPIVLEVNARPGLKIQNANLASLRTRLERIEDMDIPTSKRGVAIAQTLFAEKFAEKVTIAPQILPVVYSVFIKTKDTVKEIKAKLDTGAYRSSIDSTLAKELELPINKETVYIKSASGKAYRPTTQLSFQLAGKKITSQVSVVDRSHLKYPMIIGRIDLKGFLIRPEIDHEPDNELVDEVLSDK
ncbi:MAG TPA: sugar-transfer associated ATP-grasp domain-containing protein [Candidatus Sulfotelmatobacter sp.]|jgi:alpha-L-glutamate ligase-like protein|nr:sugar-transfer associated ATP-grasp domain-containing protein [Candidatus Sulfotelmatobacter sp.]